MPLLRLRLASPRSGLPAALDGSAVSVHFRRMSVFASTRPVTAALGAAAFEEVLTLRSPVYFSRGAKAVVKYEPHAFAVSVAASTLDLGKHEVDLTRLLPLSFEDLEDGGDSGFGKWSTSFRLSGPVRGARLNRAAQGRGSGGAAARLDGTGSVSASADAFARAEQGREGSPRGAAQLEVCQAGAFFCC
ncbi:Protein PLASTID MOVEMENT IMPAIRED 1-RELATED 1 [Zea mays]|uniref:Protein PLASTID MOVEMENT IMPAIRED 1-RELATED 1 n=1 Tax=Zea mays TaxID=4577 RepID=A0A1D6N5R9_MAIZE|nr:Protein PLASTID MOVEMENT IMPAIRED 1-RELATED 1 [Zea mays]